MKLLLVFLLFLGTLFSITWTTKTPMPQSLAGSGCAVVHSIVYVIGGRDSPGNRYATNYIYTPASDSWSTGTNMTVARAHLGCANVNDKIYAIGGWVGGTATGACEEYDPILNSWQIKTAMPTPRYTIAIAAVQGKIYVIGGMNMSGQVFNTVEEYDLVNDTWATKTPMPTARFGPGCAVIRDTIYVYGGSTVIGGGLTTVNQAYVPATDTWITKANMTSGRYCHAGFCYSNQAYALGGYDYFNYLTMCQIYDPVANSWTTDTPMQYARQSLPTAVVGNCVYAIAGWNNGALNYTEEGLIQTGVEEYSDASRDLALRASPNPFSRSIDIRYTIQDAGSEINNIKIYDASGRSVKSLNHGSWIMNHESSVTWCGDDDDGNQLPSGTYFIELSGVNGKVTEKVTLLR